jgi:hypothetical protein
MQEVFASIACVDDTGIPKNPQSKLAIINIRSQPCAASMTKDYHGFH